MLKYAVRLRFKALAILDVNSHCFWIRYNYYKAKKTHNKALKSVIITHQNSRTLKFENIAFYYPLGNLYICFCLVSNREK